MTEIRKHKRLDGADISRLIEPRTAGGHDAAGNGNSPSAPAVPVKRTNIPMVIMIFCDARIRLYSALFGFRA